jgi:hypothetical protein
VLIQRPRPGLVQVTLHAYELATLVATARWAAEGGQGELTAGALEQLRKVLELYDRAAVPGVSPS